MDELEVACLGLDRMPRRFQLVPGYEHAGIRRRPYGAYSIFYWVKDADTVEVLHVLHGSRDYPEILDPKADP